MEKRETVPCPCGGGVLEVELKSFGRWRVERLVRACASCQSVDVAAARERQKVDARSYVSNLT